MSAFNLLIGMCLLVGHDWSYRNDYRICNTCDLAEKLS